MLLAALAHPSAVMWLIGFADLIDQVRFALGYVRFGAERIDATVVHHRRARRLASEPVVERGRLGHDSG